MRESQALNVIIPMAGVGKRFQRAGYSEFKPFTPINGRPMVQWALDSFPDTVNRIIITCQNLLSEEQQRLLEEDLDCTVIFIDLHSNGPAWSIYAARESLPLDEAFFVTYCDIYWSWDFQMLQGHLKEDGIVFTRTGFHPHLVNNNFSAFCRPEEDRSQMAEIKEKASFTDDWMAEPLSVGVFYIKSGRRMITAIDQMIQQEERVSNEFFPSLLFNHLHRDGGRVGLIEVDFFIHWGLPEQLNDFLQWQKICSDPPSSLGKEGDDLPENVICMAGLGRRMSRVDSCPKALIPLDGKPMYQYVGERFPSSRTTLLTLAGIDRTIGDAGYGEDRILLPEPTASQLDTLKAAAGELMKKGACYLTSCDAYGLFEPARLNRFIREQRPDAIIFTFLHSLLQNKMARYHTHVSLEGERVTAVHIKSRSCESDVGLAGFFWVADGKLFEQLEKVSPDPDNELCADHFFKHLALNGYRVMGFMLDAYVHLGTPEELEEFHFWKRYAHHFDPKNFN
jgi:NDP-sugar pyrophosphorylase family protein